MSINILLAILIIIFAFSFEFIDTSLGGGYGTILTPIFLILGLDLFYIVPSILLSEIFTGLSGAFAHHLFENTSFTKESEMNWKICGLISTLGSLAAFISVILAFNLSELIISIYIAILVLFIGILTLRKKQYSFSWNKIVAIGVLSSFNKAISGGGFGPLVTAGQVVSGRDTKSSIATALACEAPICITSLIFYILFNGIFEPILPLLLIIGAIPATFIGAFATNKIKDETTMKTIVGIFIICLSLFLMIKVILF